MICIFVRKQTRPYRRQRSSRAPSITQSQEESVTSHISDSIGASLGSDLRPIAATASSGDALNQEQLRRLRLVSSQALLFVASYVMVSIWRGILSGFEGTAETHDEKHALLVRIYPIMVLHSIFAPLQGFFNLLVYIRPKYLKWRHVYPRETKMWAVRRAVLGDSIQPKQVSSVEAKKEECANQKECPATAIVGDTEAYHRLPRGMVSSLSASLEDSNHEAMSADIEDGRGDGGGGHKIEKPLFVPSPRASRFYCNIASKRKGLQSISEISATEFEPYGADAADSEAEDPVFPLQSDERSESRWGSGSKLENGRQPTAASSLNLSMPIRLRSEASEVESYIDVSNVEMIDEANENADGITSPMAGGPSRSSFLPRTGADFPIQVPPRRASLSVSFSDDSLSPKADYPTRGSIHPNTGADFPIQVPSRMPSLGVSFNGDSLSPMEDYPTRSSILANADADIPIQVPSRMPSLSVSFNDDSLSPMADHPTCSSIHPKTGADFPIQVPSRLPSLSVSFNDDSLSPMADCPTCSSIHPNTGADFPIQVPSRMPSLSVSFNDDSLSPMADCPTCSSIHPNTGADFPIQVPVRMPSLSVSFNDDSISPMADYPTCSSILPNTDGDVADFSTQVPSRRASLSVSFNDDSLSPIAENPSFN
eukprot:scaffold2799_cov117-Cylindrotheca_fusiformis.AAC.6